MEKQTDEWFRQSAYDMDTADFMYQGGRYIYAVFMCHLAVEKALKGLYHEKCRDVPLKSHNLVFLLHKTGVDPPEAYGKFLVRLSQASIPTRYPENLARIQQAYTESIVRDIISRGKEVIVWIKKQLLT